MTWILVLYIYAGIAAHNESVAVATVPGFTAEADCRAAGTKAKSLVSMSTKDLEFVCLAQVK